MSKKFTGGNLLAIHPQAMSVSYEARDIEEVAHVVDGIAVLCIEGPLQHKGGWFWDSYEDIAEKFRTAVECDDVRAVLLKIDSPGGDVAGLNETVAAMLAAKVRAGKPVFAFADECAYSAAYALACVADEIYLPEAGGVGSIGVVSQIASFADAHAKDGIAVEVFTSGARKADGNPNIPISDGARKHVQRRVDQLASLFWGLVSDSRGMSTKKVKALEADTFFGSEAVARGLADDVGSLDDVLAMIRSRLAQPGSGSVASTRTKAAKSGTSEKATMGILKLARDVADAEAKLAAAKTSKDEIAARASLATAQSAFAKEEAKYKRTKKVTEETEEDDGEEEDDSGDGEEEDDSGDGDSEKDESEEDEESTPADDESTAARNAAQLTAKSGLYTHERLVRLCQQITGVSDVREMFGALDALGKRASAGDDASRRIARLEKSSRRERVTAMLAKAREAGKLTKKMVGELEAKGLEDPKWLKGYLGTLPRIVEDTPREGVQEIGGAQVTSDQMRIWKKMGLTDQQIEAAAKEHASIVSKTTTKGAN